MKTTLTKMIRTALVASVLTVGFGLMPLSMAHAAAPSPVNPSDYGLTNLGQLKGTQGQGAIDPYKTVINVINIVLSLLGLVAVVIILFAGFKWMTAAGDDSKVADAQKMLIQGCIGLIIILSAWGIAQWAFTIPTKVIQ